MKLTIRKIQEPDKVLTELENTVSITGAVAAGDSMEIEIAEDTLSETSLDDVKLKLKQAGWELKEAK